MQAKVERLETEVKELKMAHKTEVEGRAKVSKELHETKVTVEELQDRLEKEKAKAGGLRDGLKEKMKEVSQLMVKNNELTIDFNFKLERKVGRNTGACILCPSQWVAAGP